MAPGHRGAPSRPGVELAPTEPRRLVEQGPKIAVPSLPAADRRDVDAGRLRCLAQRLPLAEGADEGVGGLPSLPLGGPADLRQVQVAVAHERWAWQVPLAGQLRGRLAPAEGRV